MHFTNDEIKDYLLFVVHFGNHHESFKMNEC